MFYYVDHTSRFGRNTGIQRCVRIIARALIELGVPLRPVVWSADQRAFTQASPEALQHLARWNGPAPQDWQPVPPPSSVEVEASHPTDRWLLIVELISGPHLPDTESLRRAAQQRGWQVAWVFHDAIPIRLAHLYGAQATITAERHRLYMRGLAQFQLVLANSATTADHLCTFLQQEGLPHQHVRPLPLALEFPGCPPGSPARSVPSGSSSRLLCVGSLEPRKNHRSLLKAVAALTASGRFPAQLVLVGWANDRQVVDLVQRALRLGLAVQWEPDADDQRLADLYQWCDFTVYPSLEEGFGLPVAESLWKRRPCLCSGEGALGELASGGGCFTVNTTRWQDLAQALDQLLHDAALQQRLQEELLQRVLRRWRQYAQDLLESLDQPVNSTDRQQATV